MMAKQIAPAILRVMKAQPYTADDLARAEGIVRRLHGVMGFESWCDLIAKELAAERERAKP